MHQRNLLRLMFLALAVGAMALVWPRSEKVAPPVSPDHTMESIDEPGTTTGKLSWESLPNQFFSSF